MSSPLNIGEASKEEIELHYSPSRWSHRLGPDKIIGDHVNTTLKGSEVARNCVDCDLGFSYGLGEKEKLDIYGAQTLPGEAPVFIYIHGGYWQELGREMSSFMVPPLAKAGAVVAVIGYDLAPKVSLDEIVRQVTKGVVFVLTMAVRRGSRGVYLCGSSAGGHLAAMMLAQDWLAECMVNHSFIKGELHGVYLCGSSAGGHLAAMMLAQDWLAECMVNQSCIKGAVLVSGVFDLRPIVNTYINDALKMTEDDAKRNSPMNVLDKIVSFSQNRSLIVAYGDHDPPEFHRQSKEMAEASKGVRFLILRDDAKRNSPMNVLDKIVSFSQNRSLIVAYGDHDPPEFHRQSREMAEALIAHSVKCRLMEVPDTDHFSVIENLQYEDYILTQALIAHSVKCRLMEVPDTDHFSVIENLQYEDYILTQECIKLMGLNIDSVLGPMENAKISS